VRLRTRGLGLCGTLARMIILRAQQTRYRGRGGYVAEAFPQQDGLTSFRQAEIEGANFESFFQFFPDYLVKDALREKEVLDFGSGYGGRTVEYKLCGAKRVCGVEPFENMVTRSQRYAEHRGVHDVEFKVCGHKEIPYPDASFDVVISYDVLEHVEDPRASVAEIRRVLRPGGLSLNVFPVYFGARSHHLDYITNVPGLHWLFSSPTLVRAVNSILAENAVFGVALQPEPRRSFDGSRYVLPGLNGLSGWHLKKLFEEFETISLERYPLHWWEPGRGRIAAAVARSYLPTIIRDAATNSIACMLRKPGPAGSIPLPPAANSLSITPLKGTDWALTAPARLTGDCITIRGAVPFAQAYAAVSPAYRLPRGARIAATGTVRRGGITLGLLNSNEQFATTVAIPLGRFCKFVDAPAEGTYRIVIANNLSGRQTSNDVEVTEIGLVELDPAEHRVKPPEIAQITSLEADAWEVVFPPTQREGKVLRLTGEPASAMAYAAKSAQYRLPKGALVAAAGTVQQGGLLLGLLDRSEQWAVTTAIGEGPFRTGIEVPIDGEYRIVIANNLSAWQTSNDVEISEIGLVELDPAEHRVPEREIAQITPLEVDAWEVIWPPTRHEGKGLRLTGKPAFAAAYGAKSAQYQFPKGALVGAAGTVRQGGILLGLLDRRDQWAVTTAIGEGPFRTGIEVPVDGEYRIVIAHNLSGQQASNDAEVSEIGLVELDPAEHRVKPPERTSKDSSRMRACGD
jgi:SAM-dependent methyltransferase